MQSGANEFFIFTGLALALVIFLMVRLTRAWSKKPEATKPNVDRIASRSALHRAMPQVADEEAAPRAATLVFYLQNSEIFAVLTRSTLGAAAWGNNIQKSTAALQAFIEAHFAPEASEVLTIHYPNRKLLGGDLALYRIQAFDEKRQALVFEGFVDLRTTDFPSVAVEDYTVWLKQRLQSCYRASFRQLSASEMAQMLKFEYQLNWQDVDAAKVSLALSTAMQYLLLSALLEAENIQEHEALRLLEIQLNGNASEEIFERVLVHKALLGQHMNTPALLVSKAGVWVKAVGY